MWNRVFVKHNYRYEKLRSLNVFRTEFMTGLKSIFLFWPCKLRQLNESQTDTRAGEQRLNLALEASRTVIFEWELSTGKIHCSNNYEQVFGFTRPRKWNLELYCENVVHPEDREYTQSVFKLYIERGRDFHIEHRIIWPDRSVHWISTVGRVQKDGRDAKLTGVAVDITARKEIEEERLRLLRQSHLDLEKICEEREIREKFVATLSHDLRNPLSAAKISAQLLSKVSNFSEYPQQLISRVISSIERTDQMIQDLLDANRIRAGYRLPLDVEPTELSELVVEVLDELSFIYGQRFQFDGSRQIAGYWCKRGLSRVLENLGVNAIKYGYTETLITFRLATHPDGVQIAVHNEGEPLRQMNKSVFLKVFDEPFPPKKVGSEDGV